MYVKVFVSLVVCVYVNISDLCTGDPTCIWWYVCGYVEVSILVMWRSPNVSEEVSISVYGMCMVRYVCGEACV